MNQETEKIFSSTGNLGVSRRQDNRLYVNANAYSHDAGEIRTLSRVADIVERQPEKVSRGVFRGVVSEEVFSAITENGLHDQLEVALPLAEFKGGQDRSHLVVWAHNIASRQQIRPTEEMIAETAPSLYKEAGMTPVLRIERVRQQGGKFFDSITSSQTDQIQTLWGPTFGWSQEEIEGLQKRLESEREIEPSERSVWFSAISYDDRIVSLAMAERLSIPAAEGALDLVESTEWKTCESQAGKGLMTANLIVLHAQILKDLRESSNGLPLIYAECNFQSRSDRAGHGAGMVIPDRVSAPQILRQNVNVRDGSNLQEGTLRDFTFLYLPTQTIERDYDPVQVDTLLQKGGLL